MCGRFTQSFTWRELVELYRLTQPARNLRPRYNIAPTTAIDVVRSAETGPELVPLGAHSGLVEKDRQGSAIDVQRAG
jgi:putative SOS response-associated peptidase YedK